MATMAAAATARRPKTRTRARQRERDTSERLQATAMAAAAATLDGRACSPMSRCAAMAAAMAAAAATAVALTRIDSTCFCFGPPPPKRAGAKLGARGCRQSSARAFCARSQRRLVIARVCFLRFADSHAATGRRHIAAILAAVVAEHDTSAIGDCKRAEASDRRSHRRSPPLAATRR